MSLTGLAQFDSTIQTTNTWLKELMERMGWHDRHLPITPYGPCCTPSAIGCP
jgi:hypothetical protein